MSLISINPATGDEIRSYPQHSSEEVKFILAQVVQEQESWRETE